jgi:hypothetical protein
MNQPKFIENIILDEEIVVLPNLGIGTIYLCDFIGNVAIVFENTSRHQIYEEFKTINDASIAFDKLVKDYKA